MAVEGDPDAKPRTLVSRLENSVAGRREPGKEAGLGRVLGVSGETWPGTEAVLRWVSKATGARKGLSMSAGGGGLLPCAESRAPSPVLPPGAASSPRGVPTQAALWGLTPFLDSCPDPHAELTPCSGSFPPIQISDLLLKTHRQ